MIEFIALALLAAGPAPINIQTAPPSIRTQIEIPPPAPPAIRTRTHQQVPISAVGIDSDVGDSFRFRMTNLWDVRVDRTLRACYAVTVYDDGTVMRIAHIPDDRSWRIGFGNNLWQSLQDGQPASVQMTLWPGALWGGDGVVTRVSSFPWVFVRMDTPFVPALRQASSFDLELRGVNFGRRWFGGFAEMAPLLAECQQTVDVVLDPFATPQ